MRAALVSAVVAFLVATMVAPAQSPGPVPVFTPAQYTRVQINELKDRVRALEANQACFEGDPVALAEVDGADGTPWTAFATGATVTPLVVPTIRKRCVAVRGDGGDGW